MRWLRFNYGNPIQVRDDVTGIRTGKSRVFLKAIRSDGVFYSIWVDIDDRVAASDEAISVTHKFLRVQIEPFLCDATSVGPIPADSFKGHINWVEADIDTAEEYAVQTRVTE